MKYNGYTNYATWRVMLEIVEQIDIEFAVEEGLRFDAEMVKDHVEYAVFGDKDPDNLMAWYAQAFLSEVNYVELAMHLNDEILLRTYPPLIQDFSGDRPLKGKGKQ